MLFGITASRKAAGLSGQASEGCQDSFGSCRLYDDIERRPRCICKTDVSVNILVKVHGCIRPDWNVLQNKGPGRQPSS